jgi:hypothetical protein
MKLILLLSLILLTSCKSQRDECVEGLMKEKDYDYESACEACDEEASAINHY